MANLPPPMRLVRRTTSHDTVRTLETFLEKARRGDVVGLAYGVVFGGKEGFEVGNVGECERNPGFARQIILELDDYLSEQTKN